MAPVCCAADPRSGVTLELTRARCWSAGSTLTRGGDFSIVRNVRVSVEQPQRFYEARFRSDYISRPFILVCMFTLAPSTIGLELAFVGSLRATEPVELDYHFAVVSTSIAIEFPRQFAAVRPVLPQRHTTAAQRFTPRRRRDTDPHWSRAVDACAPYTAKPCPRAARQNAYPTRLRGD